MTVPQLREWLRGWVARTTGQPLDQISDDRPMEEFGLSSRDAVALSGEIEELVGVMLTATVVYQHPTIASLATIIIEGEPDTPQVLLDDSYFTDRPVPAGHRIAIVGLSTRLPGSANTPDETWKLLIEGRDGITELPEGRWEEFRGDRRLSQAIDDTTTLGGYLDDVKGFDPEFFAMSPLEAENVDPQQRLMLELAWEALEHAHIPASELKGELVGVFVGSSTSDYQFLALAAEDPHPYALTGTSSSILPNRVSYFYDFRGPSIAVDTACSSTLVAVNQAVRSLREGTSDLALAGGVNMLLAPAATLGFGKTGVLAPNGRIKAFSSDADGMIRSEGAGFVVLKRLEDAERDGDDILAVIEGSAVNQDGRSNGLLAPNPDAQADVLRAAYRDARIVPRTVDYIEAHGTGTILGDPIEADALGRVVGAGRTAENPALLGSAKTNFGHLESAAGAASLAKVVLAMRENVLPASLHYAGPNPYIPWDAAHLKVTDQATPWPRYSGRAIAGVSGFGFGGTNAHVVLSEYVPADAPDAQVQHPDAAVAELAGIPVETPADHLDTVADTATTGAEAADTAPADAAPAEEQQPAPAVALPISANTVSRRKLTAADLADWLDSDAGRATPLTAVAHTLASRSRMRSRAVVLAHSHDEAVAGLRAAAAGKPAPNVLAANGPDTNGDVWVFSGYGAQHRKMAKVLYQDNAAFAAAFDRVDDLIEDEAGYRIRDIVLDDSQTYDFENSQVGTFAIQVALVDVLRGLGARPAAVVGHSMGEVAAAYAAGGLGLEDAVRIICVRSRLLGEGQDSLSEADAGAMALVEYSAAEVTALAEQYPGVEPSVYAAPTHTTVGGPRDAVQKLVDRAVSEDKIGRILDVRGAGHTSAVDPLLGELHAELMGLEVHPTEVGLFSTVDADTYYPAGSQIHREEYWVKGMRHVVHFTQAIRKAVEAGFTSFVEIAPHPIALMSVAATTWDAGLPDAALIATLKRKEDERETLLAAEAQLFVRGRDIAWDRLYPAGPWADVPPTRYQRRPLWITGADTGRLTGALAAPGMPGTRVALPDGRFAWETEASTAESAEALVSAAAAQVLDDVTVATVLTRGAWPSGGSLTTTLSPHPGGASLQVHAADSGRFTLVAEAVVTGGGDTSVAAVVDVPAVVTAPAPAVDRSGPIEELPEVVENVGGKWDPDSGESIRDRLCIIVGEAMGYSAEDVPVEVPLIDLGLDSLMAVRIKNRAEYEFDIPTVQITAVRDANLLEVEKYVRYAVENREEVAALAERQAAERATDASEDVAQSEPEAQTAPAATEAAAADTSAAEAAQTSLDDELADVTTSVVAEAEAIVEAEAAAETEASTAATSTAAVTETAVSAADTVPAPAAAGTEDIAAAAGSDVAPRDAAERLTFASWAVITGKSAGGIFNTLPVLDDETAERLAARLSERAKGEITVDDILDAETIEELSSTVREHLEGGGVDGFMRTLRARPEGSNAVPVFVFHASGSSTVVYEPLLKRLPASTPMYGFERVEGSVEDRAAQYITRLREVQGDGPYVLFGWSLGGVLAYEVARQLTDQGADVRHVGLLDTVLPYEPIPETVEERRLRWERYAKVGERLYNTEIPLPFDRLANASDDEQIQIILELVSMSGTTIPSGIIEHQRTSWLDNRALQSATLYPYDGDVTLYLADTYHDDMIELEPRYGKRAPDGGWGNAVAHLEIVHIGGNHLAVIDEPLISLVAADLSAKLERIESSAQENS
ncbi:polyketide synthase Pks13 [Millisia brevis]|uniref:polyketide synthase Pks13 n=1 Tax=Millisia brevis TaxID=264148 RepID=UPI00082BC618|nr:polyketide synthase Pks13 [Millisia brevis]